MNSSPHHQKKIFLVADNCSSSLALIDLLNNHGFHVVFGTGTQSLRSIFINDPPDLVILDEISSGAWTFEKSKNIRSEYHGPIVVISDNNADTHHIQSLVYGADDFIAKPFNPFLLLARLNALLSCFDRGNGTEKNRLHFDGLIVDLFSREVIIKGKKAMLTSIEFDILSYLAKNSGRVVSRNDVHLALYNSEHNGYDRSLDTYVSKIRQKIGDTLAEPHYLKTVRGVGYLFMGVKKNE